MQRSYDLYFVSSNKHKFEEAKKILNLFDVEIKFFKYNLEEIQSDSLEDIATFKAKYAFSKLQRALIIEDDGLFIEALGGFPGPYSSYVFNTIGNTGILKLVNRNRNANFVSIITFCNGNQLKHFVGSVSGNISKKSQGEGWGYDPIFIPENSKQTFAELENKNELSHRFQSLKKFSNWYTQLSNDR